MSQTKAQLISDLVQALNFTGTASAPANGLFLSAANTLKLATASTERLKIDGTEVVVNGTGASVDFRIEGDTETNLLFADASTNRIGIGTSSPSEELDVSGEIQLTNFLKATGDLLLCADVDNNNSGTAIRFLIDGDSSSDELMRIKSDGNVGIGTISTDFNCEIEGTGGGTGVSLGITNTGSDPAGINLKSGHGNWSIYNSHSVGDALEFRDESASTVPMIINSSGNVGIGTTSPRSLLDLGGGSGDGTLSQTLSEYQIVFEAPQGTGDIGRNIAFATTTTGISAAINAVDLGASSLTGLSFATGSASAIAERMRIDSSGNVGIGTTSPSAKIHADNGGSGNVAFLKHASSGVAVTLVLQNNRATGSIAGEQISFLDDSGTQRGKITNTTSETTYSTISDYRLKENEVLISDGIERIKKLKPYKFNWKHLPNKTVDGFFAHEVENLIENCVDGTKDRVVTKDDHDKGDYLDKEIGTEIHQMMDHSKLVPLLVAAVQELIGKVEALEAA